MSSFYDLDYIIQINEKRLEEYSNAYSKNMDKFTNILVLYSAFAIFIIPIIQILFFSETTCYFMHHLSFYIFTLLFLFSLVNTARLLIPVNVAYLQEPKIYYEEYRLGYEAENRTKEEVDNLIKASYINELERAVSINNNVFKRKGLFYYRALIFALLACIPYLTCIGYQISSKDEKVQKVEIVNKFSNFRKSTQMSNDKNKPKPTSSTTTTSTTKLPGVDNSQVRPSQPQLVKENFDIQKRETKTPKK